MARSPVVSPAEQDLRRTRNADDAVVQFSRQDRWCFAGRTVQVRVHIGVQVHTTCTGCAGASEANEAPRSGNGVMWSYRCAPAVRRASALMTERTYLKQKH